MPATEILDTDKLERLPYKKALPHLRSIGKGLEVIEVAECQEHSTPCLITKSGQHLRLLCDQKPFCDFFESIIPVPVGGLDEVTYALVDAPFYRACSLISWGAHVVRGKVYAKGFLNGKAVYLHRFILSLTSSDEHIVDHRNGDSLDCRKQNLRIADNFGNSRNRQKVLKPCSSRFKGVTAKGNKWCACTQGKYLGTFDTEAEAARAYDRKAVELFGEYARLNFPEEWSGEEESNLRHRSCKGRVLTAELSPDTAHSEESTTSPTPTPEAAK